MTNKYIRICLWAALVFLATTQAVLAATVAAMSAPLGLDLHWGTALLSFAICTLSGVASLLQRISKELRLNPGEPLPHPLLFIATNMTGSWLAGALAFILGQSVQADVWKELGSMIVASYAGAVIIEAYVEAKMPKFSADPPAAP